MPISDVIAKVFGTSSEKESEKPTEVEKPLEEKAADDKTSQEKEDSSKKEDESEKKEEPKLDQRTEKALEFLKILEDPKTAVLLARDIITRAESQGHVETKEEKKALKDRILDTLKESTHEDNHYIIEAMGPGLIKLITEIENGAEVKTKALEKRFEALKEAEDEAKAVQEFEQILDDPKYKDYLPELEKLTERIQPAQGISVREYLDDLLEIAKSRKNGTTQKVKAAEKISRNVEEADPSSKGKSTDDVVVTSKRLSLKESIQLAAEGKKVARG